MDIKRIFLYAALAFVGYSLITAWQKDYGTEKTIAISQTGTASPSAQNNLLPALDGDDTSSRVKIHEAIEKAQKADSLIYAIGIGDQYYRGVIESALRKITEQTGGRAYFPHNDRELREAFSQIQRDLREQYLVAYSPSNKARDGSYRRIQIEIINPELKKESLKLNYRQGYFAKAPETGSGTPVRKKP